MHQNSERGGLCGQQHPIRPDFIELTFDVRCQCGRPLRVPLRRDWSSPLYVMAMEREHEYLRNRLADLTRDLIELAGECVEAGVRPSVLKRADEVRRLLDELKRRFGNEPGE